MEASPEVGGAQVLNAGPHLFELRRGNDVGGVSYQREPAHGRVMRKVPQKLLRGVVLVEACRAVAASHLRRDELRKGWVHGAHVRHDGTPRGM